MCHGSAFLPDSQMANIADVSQMTSELPDFSIEDFALLAGLDRRRVIWGTAPASLVRVLLGLVLGRVQPFEKYFSRKRWSVKCPIAVIGWSIPLASSRRWDSSGSRRGFQSAGAVGSPGQ